MADVQLEKGHLRIANELNRAMLVARFSPVQHRLVHLLIALTYGWGRRTVEISVPDLARLLDLTNSGGFRTALAELVDAGVVLLLRAGTGRTRSVFAPQKDYERWGRFSVSSQLLAERFGNRPRHADTLLAISGEADDGGGDAANEQPDDDAEGARTEAPSIVNEGASLEASLIEAASPEAPRVPRQSHEGCLATGTLTGSNPLFGETCERGKTLKDSTTNYDNDHYARARDEGASPEAPSIDPDSLPQWPQLAELLASDHNRAAVLRFLSTVDAPVLRLKLVSSFCMWLTGHDCPPTLQPAPDVLATALGEFTGDPAVRHVWAWVESVVRRFQRAAGSGIRVMVGFPPRASPIDQYRPRAAALWVLIKREGLASCPPATIASRIDALADAGDIPDKTAFLAVFHRLNRSALAGARTDQYAISLILSAVVDDATAA